MAKRLGPGKYETVGGYILLKVVADTSDYGSRVSWHLLDKDENYQNTYATKADADAAAHRLVNPVPWHKRGF